MQHLNYFVVTANLILIYFIKPAKYSKSSLKNNTQASPAAVNISFGRYLYIVLPPNTTKVQKQ